MKERLRNLKVKQKLFIAFSLVVLFLVAISGIGLYNVSNIENHTVSIGEEHLPSTDLLLQIDRDMQQAVVAQRTMIFSNVGTEIFEQLKKENEENISQAKDRWEQYKSYGHNGVSEDLVSNYEKARGEWIKYSNRIVNARESDTPEGRIEAIELSFREGSRSFEAAREIINNLTELTEKISSEEVAASKADYQSAFWVMSVGALIIIVLSILAGAMISKLIGEPLVKAAEMMSELKKGHLDTRINIKGKDEIGVLAESMDSFADTLQGFGKAMYQVADGNLDIEVQMLDTEDQITPALNKILKTLRDLKTETGILISDAMEGRLDKRGNVDKFNGGYREIVKGFNDTLDAVILPVNEGSQVLQTMATGDLSIRVTGNYKGDHQKIKNSINELGDSLSKLLTDVSEAVQATASASNEISASAEEMAAGSQEQSNQTAEVASAVEQMTTTIMQTTKNATSAAEFSKKAGGSAKSGGEVVKQTVNGMNRIAEVVDVAATTVKELGNSSNQIGEIIQVIDDIADQTNLLALNAAIEAARAGEQGRGFAVVADEVRKLAERTTKATKEIAAMIKQIQKDTGNAVESMETGTKEVQAGKELAGKAIIALDEIIGSTNETIDVINQVAAASEEQSSAAEQISKSIEGISNVTQEAAAGIQQIARASEDLSNLTTNLQSLVGKFRINSSTDNSEYSKLSVRSNGKIIHS